MHALTERRPKHRLSVLEKTRRKNLRIVKEKIADYVDPPRFVPLIGPAQLHHAHYKCTIYSTEETDVGWPVPHKQVDENAQAVIYIDHQHFHHVRSVAPTSYEDRNHAPAVLNVDDGQALTERRVQHAQRQEVKLALSKTNRGDTYVKVYTVADLVIPLPKGNRATHKVDKDVSPAEHDLESLITLITSTIEPESWDKLGGTGAIEPFETNFSLVISQSERVHEQIADLLEQIRRVMDLQVVMSVESFHIEDEKTWQLLATDFELNNNVAAKDHHILSARESNLLRRLINEQDRAAILGGPKVTLFNCQSAEFPLSFDDRQAKVELFPCVSPDRRSLSLECRVSVAGETCPSGLHRAFIIKDRGSMLLDVTALLRTTRQRGIPFLGDLPSLGRVFMKTSSEPATGRTLVMIRPQIHIREEEELRIGEPSGGKAR